jgi:hypothetical protein
MAEGMVRIRLRLDIAQIQLLPRFEILLCSAPVEKTSQQSYYRIQGEN